MPFKMINESFVCEQCWYDVPIHPTWSARNHCPKCLYSKHLDESYPWDRASKCHWLMAPIWLDHKKNKWIMIIHKCEKCGKQMLNKVAEDDEDIYNIKSPIN